MPPDGTFYFKYIMEGEDIFVGAEIVTHTIERKLTKGQHGVFLLNFELEKHITKCADYPTINPCVHTFYDQEYGVDFRSRMNKSIDFTVTVFGGRDKLYQRTNCHLPCRRTKFPMEEFRTFELRNIQDPNVKQYLKHLNSTGLSGLLVRTFKYTLINF